MLPELHGIDVSDNNRIRNWSDVPGTMGVTRACQGSWYSDKDYDWNISRIRDTKRYHGIYMVVEPVVDTVRGLLQTAEAQADKFVRVVGPPRVGSFGILDWESPRKLVPPPPLEDVLAVMAAIEERGWRGRMAWYTFYSLAKNTVPAFTGRPLWLSTLGNGYELGYKWCLELGATVWQYDQGEVEGATSSPIDINMILDEARMDTLCGLEAVPVEPEPEEDEMTYFQMDGDQGGVYVFGPNGYVFMSGAPDVHTALHEGAVAKIVATKVPQAQLDQFAADWKAGMGG